MSKRYDKRFRLARRAKRVRKKISGTPEQPRLAVSRSLGHIYAQIIDDTTGRTLAAASSVQLKISGGNADAAKKTGQAIAEKAKAASITRIRFDRRGRLYHGRIKALADAARKAGLEF